MVFMDRVRAGSVFVEERNRLHRFNPLSIGAFAPGRERDLVNIKAKGFPRINKVKVLLNRRPIISRALTVFNPIGLRVKLFGQR